MKGGVALSHDGLFEEEQKPNAKGEVTLSHDGLFEEEQRPNAKGRRDIKSLPFV
ncbi:hypothetical protein SPV1_10371 [Mariprofundus ferrooxydans PV-1]|uniref:Uncharacterized protein n=1 Tax=Mariprofundus ferrooxydans PV-1 TaxID=314345 RepID=Q0F1R2_9PROT|nr:hypothetical protein SPV1_10371 [Mariprofundus ferrooxydans PV-1]